MIRTKQVPALALREDMVLRGWAPKPTTQPERPLGEVVSLYIGDQPTLKTFESRCAAANLGRDGIRTFLARAEPLLAGHVPDKKVRFVFLLPSFLSTLLGAGCVASTGILNPTNGRFQTRCAFVIEACVHT